MTTVSVPNELCRLLDSARKLAEDEARAGAARFRAFFEATTVGMVEARPDGRIVMANGAFCRMIEYTSAELCEMTVGDVLFPEDRDRVLAQYAEVAAGRVPGYEADRRYRRKDGSALWARVSVVAQEPLERPPGVSAVVLDLTNQKHLEEQFRHARKMEAVGVRASGIAHDFNNLLAVITGCAEALLDGLPSAAPTRELMWEMTAACRRATGLTAQLLAFSRKAVLEQRSLNLNEVVAPALQLLHHLLGSDITLVADLAHDLRNVRADPTQLEQVILNLAMNARDAMPRGGRLTVETHGIRVRPEDRGAYPDLAPGEYVQLAVSDTGAGMTDAVRARAFEPFFTTKETGRGTGLGLAIVHGAVAQWGGRIDVSSEPGVGTIFGILLPAVASDSSGAGVGRPVPRGVGTILLVGTEDEVRKLTRLALTAHGYGVLEAASGAEALRLAWEHTGSIDLLVTDVVLPELGVREVADGFRVRHPNSKVLYVRGAADEAVRLGTGEVIRKPFTPVSLVHRVRAVLDGRV